MQKLQIPPERITANPLELYQHRHYPTVLLSTPDEQIQQWQQALDKVLREQGEKSSPAISCPRPLFPTPGKMAPAIDSYFYFHGENNSLNQYFAK